MKFYSYLKLYTKINTKWIKDRDIRGKTIGLLEEIRMYLHDLGFRSGYLDIIAKQKKTLAKLDFIQIKNLFFTSHHQDSEKDNPQNGSKYLKIIFLIRDLYLTVS